MSVERTLTDERHRQEAAERSTMLAEPALAEEQHRSLSAEAALAEYDAQTKASRDATTVEVAKHAMTLVVSALAELEATPKLRYSGPTPTHFSPPLTAAEVAKLDATILNKQRSHEMAAQEKALADDACERRCRESAKCTAASAKSALAAERAMVSADLALPEPALAEDKRRQEETAKKQRHSDDECVMVPVLPPNPVNVAIRRIWVECALLAAPLDVILAEIDRDNITNEA